ncbi:unnamed protein product [Echinostoma caproni]|uniref:WW domain-containing protein n=1 Tax=Echinostoma caproni TaxID=27848 RepID=A0A183AUV0_9TREM|nr:unnamed protein product [Echinostoma caproni]
MMKDIARDPSLAKRYGIVLTEEQEQAYKREGKLQDKEKDTSNLKKPQVPPPCEWREATASDGRKYYWNTVTRETRWTQPEGVSIAPELLSVKEEKNKLKQFVLNRLVELSESGSTEATEAVHQAFNAPIPSPETNDIPKSTADKRKQTTKPDEASPLTFHGPKIDLLGQWVPVEESPQKKMPKLDLPGEKEHRASTSVTSPTSEDTDSRTAVLAHLEETTFADIHGAGRLETGEKQLTPGSVSVPGSTNRNVPRVVFRKGNSSVSNRSFRTTSTAD